MVKPTTQNELRIFLNCQQDGLSIRAFAQKLGIGYPAYFKYVKGKRELGPDMMARVFAVYPELASNELMATARPRGYRGHKNPSGVNHNTEM